MGSTGTLTSLIVVQNGIQFWAVASGSKGSDKGLAAGGVLQVFHYDLIICLMYMYCNTNFKRV